MSSSHINNIVFYWIFLSNVVHICTGYDTQITSGGIPKNGGVFDLPPCLSDGIKIVHGNKSCIFIASSDDTNIRTTTAGRSEDTKTNDNKTGTVTNRGSGTRGGGGDVSGSNDQKNKHEDPYDKNGKYWLVPPFLIGAFSVMVMYFVIHCLYLHCYVKPRVRQLSARNPTIILSDADGPSMASLQAYTPVVMDDGSYGTTDITDSGTFFFGNKTDISGSSTSSRRPSRRKSSFLQLPNFFSSKGGHRSSVSSAGPTLEASSTPDNASGSDPAVAARPRRSFCFVPVARTISDPTGGSTPGTEWMPMQGFTLYPSSMLPNNASLNVPGENTSNDVVPPSPVFLFPGLPASQQSSDHATDPKAGASLSAESSPQPEQRMVSRDSECDNITINVPSLQINVAADIV